MKHQMLRQVCHLVGLREFSDTHTFQIPESVVIQIKVTT